jgi:5-formyltetrahydrofolate cyclo-ligase
VTDALRDHADIERRKQLLRREFARRTFSGGPDNQLSGRGAEMLRREPSYRAVPRIFVSPAPALQQVRINCLVDGKELIMPGPGLKEGFYLLKPYTLPFHALPHAVSMKGLAKAGRRLSRAEVEKLSLALLVTGAEAVDRQGNRLGDGLGFFDLSWAMLAELGALRSDAAVAACVNAEQIVEQPLPCACWDVPADIIITENGVYPAQHALPAPRRLFWQYLSERKTRKITPLWWLRESRRR